MNIKVQDIFLSTKRQSRLASQSDSNSLEESQLIRTSRNLLLNLDLSVPENVLNDSAEALFENLYNMSKEERDFFANIINYELILEILKNAENSLTIISILKILCCLVTSKHFDFEKFITPVNLVFLLLLLDNEDCAEYSLCLIYFTCFSNEKMCNIFCSPEFDFLEKLSQNPITPMKCAMLQLLCSSYENDKYDYFLKLLHIIISYLASNDIKAVSSGLKSISHLNFNVSDQTHKEAIDQISNFILTRTPFFLEHQNNPKILKNFLLAIYKIQNLPIEFIPFLFNLLESDKTEYVLKIIYKQHSNWSDSINVDMLFNIIVPKMMNASLNFQVVCLITILKYGEFRHFIDPRVFSLIVKYVDFMGNEITFVCLSKILFVLQTAHSNSLDAVRPFLGDILEVVNNLLSTNESKEIAEIADKVLELIDQLNVCV